MNTEDCAVIVDGESICGCTDSTVPTIAQIAMILLVII